MKKILKLSLSLLCLFYLHHTASGQKRTVKKGSKFDTIIVEKGAKPASKPTAKPVVKKEIVLPVPEFINQPCYYNIDNNQLIKLENTTAQMVTKKKSLGLKGAQQFLSMAKPSSKIRFVEKKDLAFMIRTSGDVIDLTSYIKLYKFTTNEEKREATVSSKDGVLTDNAAEKGKLVDFTVKPVTKDTYMIQFSAPPEAGEYGFVWLKNMELKEFNVFAFGIDWKSSD